MEIRNQTRDVETVSGNASIKEMQDAATIK